MFKVLLLCVALFTAVWYCHQPGDPEKVASRLIFNYDNTHSSDSKNQDVQKNELRGSGATELEMAAKMYQSLSMSVAQEVQKLQAAVNEIKYRTIRMEKMIDCSNIRVLCPCTSEELPRLIVTKQLSTRYPDMRFHSRCLRAEGNGLQSLKKLSPNICSSACFGLKYGGLFSPSLAEKCWVASEMLNPLPSLSKPSKNLAVSTYQGFSGRPLGKIFSNGLKQQCCAVSFPVAVSPTSSGDFSHEFQPGVHHFVSSLTNEPMAAINISEIKYSLLRGSLSDDGISEFNREVSVGRGSSAPIKGAKMPNLEQGEPWDGKDFVATTESLQQAHRERDSSSATAKEEPSSASNTSVENLESSNGQVDCTAGKLMLEGLVCQKGECRPLADQRYMKLKRESILNASQPERQVKQLMKVVPSYKPVSDHKHNEEIQRRNALEATEQNNFTNWSQDHNQN